MVIGVQTNNIDYPLQEEEKEAPGKSTSRNLDPLLENSQMKTEALASIAHEEKHQESIEDADSSIDNVPGQGEFGENRESSKLMV